MILTGDFNRHHHHHPNMPNTIDRDEFAVYDTIKTVSFLGVILSLLTIGLGKKALFAIWKQKPNFNKKVFRKGIFLTILIAIVFLIARHHSQEAKEHVQQWRQNHNITLEDGFVPGKHHGHHRHGRKLEQEDHFTPHIHKHFWKKAKKFFTLKDNESICNAHKDGDSCYADDLCSWCTAGAVPSACHSTENAAKLPPAVFECHD